MGVCAGGADVRVEVVCLSFFFYLALCVVMDKAVALGIIVGVCTCLCVYVRACVNADVF